MFRLLHQLHVPGLLTGLSLLCQCATPPHANSTGHPAAVRAADPARWDRVTKNLAAAVPVDPAVYRAVDAGLLAARLPASLAKPLERVR